MGDEKKGDADIALQVLQFNLHLAAQLAVEGGKRFVQQQHRRPVDQGAGEGHALLLAAGQFVASPILVAFEAAPWRALRPLPLTSSPRDGLGLRWRRP